jgi:hypothetical protein
VLDRGAPRRIALEMVLRLVVVALIAFGLARTGGFSGTGEIRPRQLHKREYLLSERLSRKKSLANVGFDNNYIKLATDSAKTVVCVCALILCLKKKAKEMWVHPLITQRLFKDHFQKLYEDLRAYPPKYFAIQYSFSLCQHSLFHYFQSL